MGDDIYFTRLFSWREQVSRSLSWGHHFLFLNVLLACAIGGSFAYAGPDTETFLAFFYLVVSWLGQMSFITCVVFLLTLFPLAFLGRFRLYLWLGTIIAIISHLTLLFDVRMFLVVKSHLSLTVLNLLVGDLDFKTGINLRFMYLAVPLLILIEIGFCRAAKASVYRIHSHHYTKKAIAAALTACFIASHSIYIWADASNYTPITMLRSTFPAHYPMTARSFLETHGIKTDFEVQHDVEALNYPLAPIETAGEGQDCNLVTIIINGLSYHDLSSRDTPEILALKSRYHSFENHFLPYDSLHDNAFAMAWGLPAGYRDSLRAQRRYPVIMDEMRRQGYHNHLITDRSSLLSAGEANYLTGRSNFVMQKAGGIRDTLERAASAIMKWDPETAPHSLSVSIDALLPTAGQARLLLLHELDAALPGVFHALERQGLDDQTLVVFTSLEGNHALYSKELLYQRTQNRVPLIIMWPQQKNRGVVTRRLSSPFDLCATIGASLLAITNDSREYTVGENLFGVTERDFLVSTNRLGDLLLIGTHATQAYRHSGQALVEGRGGHRAEIRPSLKDLLKAMREINRFKE
ncbi:MAG: DUF3413 domain-containing protein [Succinivibrionaceae bacterium]|nr:DUF3413 domain-containing protein [Succinivibrionaceae bacterium]